MNRPRNHDPALAVHEVVLAEERLRSARRIAVLRVALVGAFYLRATTMAWGVAGPWEPQQVVMTAYLAIAVAIGMGAGRSDRWASISSGALTVLDLPMVLLLLWPPIAGVATDRAADSLVAVAAAFVVVILLTVLTIRPGQVAATGALALAFEALLGIELGESANAITYAMVVTAGCVAIGLYVVHRLNALVHSSAVEQTIRHRLDRHFSPEVATLLGRWPGETVSETRTITVLFSDLRGFTALSEDLTSVEVVDLLNEVHARLAACVFEHGGTLDKFLGDGMLAYFNAPLDQPDHATRAVRCARAMAREIERLNDERSARGEPALGLSVGIHTGEATLGILGPEKRHEYTAVGETVNVAAHVEKVTRETGDTILMTEATRLELSDGLPTDPLEWRPIPGVGRRIDLHRPAAGVPPRLADQVPA